MPASTTSEAAATTIIRLQGRSPGARRVYDLRRNVGPSIWRNWSHGWRVAQSHRAHEAVPLRRHRLDQRLAVASVLQHLAQRGDLKREVGFLDDGVGPEGGHQRRLLNEATVVLHEVDEQIERFGGEGNGLPVAQQEPLGRIEPKRSELVDGRHGTRA